MALSPGDPVRVVTTKWGDQPHWEFDARYLGADEHGDWIGIHTGTYMSRPALSFVTETDQVGLVPTSSGGAGGWWLATFHAPGYRVSTYVDMTSVPVWSGAEVRAVDLDLDVIKRADGSVFVDDEDEFAEHQVSYGYPADVVAGAEASGAWVHDAVRRGLPPFDATSETWFGVLAALPAPAS